MRRITTIITAFTLGAFVMGALSVACSDDDDKTSAPTAAVGSPVVIATRDPNATPGSQPTYQTTPRPATSGVVTVDKIIEAMQSRDLDELEDLLVFSEVECEANPPEGAGGPPRCRFDEDDETSVEVIAMAACEGFWSREDELVLENAPFDQAILHSVWRAPAGLYPPGQYALLFSRLDPRDGVPVFEITATDEGITGINFGCGQPAQQIIDTQRLTESIVAPL